ncbi:DUF3299 domain-containing protein [Croceimicrobium sp.]|uniref:DUF3299 domain-containing protein n=1 Tax=Croceimicrobium sp. TaxID=2828340 RepID=UPI003BAC8F5D
MKKLLILVFCLSGWGLMAQSEAKVIDWKLLAKVEFIDQYFEDFEAWYLVPDFSDEVEKLNGKKVLIKGYVIPLDVDGGKYALSAYPFSACFFCGGAGPESVMSLHFAEKPPRLETDDYLNFVGTLKLNKSDVEDFNYILVDCKLME